MKRLALAAAVCAVAASAAFAQSDDSLADSYRQAVDGARQAAARRKTLSQLEAAMRTAGFEITDGYDNDDIERVAAVYSFRIVPRGKDDAVKLVVERTDGDAFTLSLTGHPVYGRVGLGRWSSPDEFEAQTGGAAGLKALGRRIGANYPYFGEIPDYVSADVRGEIVRKTDAARARAAQEAALIADLKGLGMTVTSDTYAGVVLAADGIQVKIAGVDADVMDITVSAVVVKNPLQSEVLAQYATIDELRAKTGNLAQIRSLIEAAARN
jgi:hypothetical protein